MDKNDVKNRMYISVIKSCWFVVCISNDDLKKIIKLHCSLSAVCIQELVLCLDTDVNGTERLRYIYIYE